MVVLAEQSSAPAEVDRPETRVEVYSRTARFPAALLTVLVLYFIAWGCTLPHFMGDTIVYAQSILLHEQGVHTGYHRTTSNPYWDFGHLLWRPLVRLCFVTYRPVAKLMTHQNERAQILLTLIGLTFVVAPVCILCFFLISKKVTGDAWAAMLAATGLFSADAFLNYAHTGNAYIVALTCLVAGMYFALSDGGGSVVRAFLAGLFFALAVLFWFPYVFVIPVAIAAPMILYGAHQQRVRQSGRMLAICVVVGVVAYASVLAVLGIGNLADLRAWILASGHGQIQPGGLRPVLRLAFSFPRSIVNMGQDGMWWKRYVVHDPYAPVTLPELFRLSLWKLLLFYGTAGVACYQLWRSEPGRKLLIVTAAAVVPLVGFGVFIFQAGSIDLFLPLYPFVFLCFGYVLADKQTKPYQRILLLAFLVATATVNVNAMSRRVQEARRNAALARIRELAPMLRPSSVVVSINEQDNLAQFWLDFPLYPTNIDAQWTNYNVLEINAARLSSWRADFASRVLATWQRGGAVWLPLRVFQAFPRPEWNWVEGDDKRVRWSELPGFFSQFESGSVVGGKDGFVLLFQNPNNQRLIEAASEKRPEAP